MHRQSRADFQYSLGTFDNLPLLLIWDQDQGNMSVTNDIENVVADIAQVEAIDPKEHLIIYRDSEKQWDGWDACTEDFFHIGEWRLIDIFKEAKYRFEFPKMLKL